MVMAATAIPERAARTGEAPSAGPADSEAQLCLQTWLSPAFPTGAFAYSHGIENAVAERRIVNSRALEAWLADLLTVGGLWTDAVLFAAAHRAAAAGDQAALDDVAGLALALPPSRERLLETSAQGAAFLLAINAGWRMLGGRLGAALGPSAAYPVAVATATAFATISLRTALPGFLNAATTSLVSAAMRLIPLGQEDGLATLARLHPGVLAAAARAAAASLDDLGSAAILSDIQSMRHETLYSRLFRT